MLDRKDLDAVIIATPDHWHALPAIQAVLAGKDVYVEKPVAHNVAEGQAMITAARKTNKIMAVGTQQRSSSHFQKAVEIVRSGKLGKVFWVQTWNFENISPVGHGQVSRRRGPVLRRLRSLARPRPLACLQPQPVPPAVPLVLRLRRRHDERLGRPPQRHRALGPRTPRDPSRSTPPAASSPPTTTATRPTPCRSFTSSPECTLTYSMRKGNGLKFNGHDYGILFCGTDGSLMLDRSGFEVIPDKVVLPYGIKLVHGDRPLRKIDLKPEKAKGVDGQDAHVAQLPRLRQVASLADLRHRDRPPLHQHLPPGQHLLQARPQARMGRRDRDVQERPRGQCPARRASRARAMSCPRFEARMTKTTGHIIRISGLLIEMLGLWGVFNATGDKDQASAPAPRRHHGPAGLARRRAWLWALVDRDSPRLCEMARAKGRSERRA